MPAVVAEFLDQGRIPHVVLLTRCFLRAPADPTCSDADGVKYLRPKRTDEARFGGHTESRPEAALLSALEIKDVARDGSGGEEAFIERGARCRWSSRAGTWIGPWTVLFDGSEVLTLGGDHIKTEHTHGSGCTFASAIAAQLATGRPLREAVMLAKAYVSKAIENGFAIGKGSGPLDRRHLARTMNHRRAEVHEVPQHAHASAHQNPLPDNVAIFFFLCFSIAELFALISRFR